MACQPGTEWKMPSRGIHAVATCLCLFVGVDSAATDVKWVEANRGRVFLLCAPPSLPLWEVLPIISLLT